MTKQELLILSYFDTETGKELTDNDLTIEMRAAGIGTNEGADFQYYNIVYSLLTKDFIKIFRDPSKSNKVSVNTARKQLYVLSEIGIQVLRRNEQEKERNDYITELEFNKLRTEYNLLYNQLADYDETKQKAKKSLNISIGALIITIISTIVAILALIKD